MQCLREDSYLEKQGRLEVSPRTGLDDMVLRLIKFSRTHLFEDLQAYVCIYEECEYSNSTNGNTLKDRQMWSDHFDNNLHHFAMSTKKYECPLCLEDVISSFPFAAHLAEHLENIALTTLS